MSRELQEQHGLADSSSSWQRGSNKNSNGLLREFFRKRHHFNTITEDEYSYLLNLINHRPHKCLNWKMSHEVIIKDPLHLA